MSVIENYNEILNSVKEVSKQANHHVDILAVSKTQCVEKMTELALNNVKMFGESKVQEAVPKIEYLSSKYNDLEFHFIGKVQTNKLKKIVEYFSLIHSVDRLDVLPLIDKYAHELNKKQNILIQINIAYEMQKNGIDRCLPPSPGRSGNLFQCVPAFWLPYSGPHKWKRHFQRPPWG